MQGELFSAQVVSFPVDSRTVLIRRTARRLIELENDKKTATEFWTETCLQLKADRIKGGWTENEARADMDAFAESVTEEMRHIIWAQEAQSHA